MTPTARPHSHRLAQLGLVAGPLLALATYLMLSSVGGAAAQLDTAGRVTAAVAVWMATWWLSEALPLAATALLPLVVFPLAGALSIREAAAPYASPLIFLFLGGFIIGLALQRFGLHRRVALHLLLVVGTSPRRLVAGFMLASALLSMWISNTATAIMMLPIGASVLAMLREQGGSEDRQSICTPAEMSAFGTALVLGIAYACSIGGIGTLVGTPPNLVLAAFLGQHYGIDLSMARWLGVGLPLVLILLPLTWWYLTHLALRVPATHFPYGSETIRAELARLGPMRRGELTALVVFLLAAVAWILRPQLAAWSGLAGLDDTVIALTAALLLFVIPVDSPPRTFAMDWATASKLPWEILILFGGGLSLAAAIGANGVDAFVASGFTGLAEAPAWVLVLVVVTTVVFLTEVTSNTAVTTTLMPVLAATAAATGTAPGLLLTSAAMAASCAFMLPVATPPNAIVFASGYVRIGEMARVGLGLNLLAILVVTVTVYLGNRLFLS